MLNGLYAPYNLGDRSHARRVLSAGSKPPVFLNGNVIAENNLIKFQDISSRPPTAVALLLELRRNLMKPRNT